MLSAAKIREQMLDARIKEFNSFKEEINTIVGRSMIERKHFADLMIPGLITTWPVRMSPRLSPSQEIVIEELFSESGFGADIMPGEEFVPLGLQDENGDGPKYRNYFIQIGW